MPPAAILSVFHPRTYEVYLVQREGHNHTRYILQDSDGNLYQGIQARYLEEILAMHPAELARLPRTSLNAKKIFPLLNACSISVYQGPFDGAVHVKKQALLNGGSTLKENPKAFKQLMTRELLVADELRRHPHPNVCVYHGAVVHPVSKLVTGLVYKRYTMDLDMFVREGNLVSTSQIATIMDGITAGMKHLHSLRIVHCDLRPPNIFLQLGVTDWGAESIEEVVLGDFDACVRLGERIEMKFVQEEFRHPEYDFGAKVATVVDTFALEEVGRWLKRRMKFGGPL